MSSSEPYEMSAATREILGKVRQMVPPMLEKFHKGEQQATRVPIRVVLFRFYERMKKNVAGMMDVRGGG